MSNLREQIDDLVRYGGNVEATTDQILDLIASEIQDDDVIARGGRGGPQPIQVARVARNLLEDAGITAPRAHTPEATPGATPRMYLVAGESIDSAVDSVRPAHVPEDADHYPEHLNVSGYPGRYEAEISRDFYWFEEPGNYDTKRKRGNEITVKGEGATREVAIRNAVANHRASQRESE